jgi:hypothetical protein
MGFSWRLTLYKGGESGAARMQDAGDRRDKPCGGGTVG